MNFPSRLIQFLSPERLIRYENNARTHSPEQVRQIARSIEKFGFVNPLIVDENSGIIAGHGRLLAARRLGLKEVPVIVFDHLTETQKRAYVIADNKLALNADWDQPKLQAELAELKQDLFDLELIGFDEDELERLTADLDTELGKTDEDAVPDVAEVAVSVAGDLWILGNHRALCGDARSIHDMEKVMAGERAMMAFTDPPYNANYEQQTITSGQRKIANDNLGDGFEPFLHDACVNILLVTEGAVYICMSSAQLHTLYQAFTRAGGHWSTFVMWVKDQFTLGRSDYQRQYEPILYGWKRGGKCPFGKLAWNILCG